MRNLYKNTAQHRAAQAQAASLQAFWHDQGQRHVQAWAEEVVLVDGADKSCGFNEHGWTVVSNLVNGLPPRLPIMQPDPEPLPVDNVVYLSDLK
jgi:hypothetical protein